MKLKHYIYAAAAMFMLAACDDFNDRLDGYSDDDYKPLDIKNEKYLLTANDYAKIAVEADAASISSNKAFDNAEQAHALIPNLLLTVYPVADNGSSIKVSYDVADDAASCLSRLRKAKSYTLVAADYDYLYGDDEEVRVLSASALENMASLLLEKAPGAQSGDIMMVNYNADSHGPDSEYGPENRVTDFTSSKLFEFDGAAWKELTSDDHVVAISPLVYHSIGNTFIENGEVIIPKYLSSMFPFAKDGDTHTVAYYYNKYKDVGALKYIYDDGGWMKIGESFKTTKVQRIDPFVLADGVWCYDPSVTIELPDVKKNPESAKVYQAIVDWVWANVDQPAGVSKGQGYVAKYGDTDFYCGASSYDCVVDWRAESARKQCAEAYKDMTDDEVSAAMQANFIKVLGDVLPSLYPDALPVQGLDVIYTVNFTAKSASEQKYTVQYKVVGKAAFQYVEGSLKVQ